MPLILPGNVGSATAATGYNVDNSLRFNDGSSDYLNKTYGSAGNRKTWTFSAWFKLSSGGGNTIFSSYTDGNNWTDFYFSGTNKFEFVSYASGYLIHFTSSQVFRDYSAWTHIVLAFDTTQSTASDRIKLYVNGSQVTALDNNTYPNQNSDHKINSTDQHRLGLSQTNAAISYDGYMAEVCFIDGSQLAPTEFGEFDEDSGIWKPIDVSGLTFGTNGFYLDFEDSGALGDDVSGNGNDFTVNNLTSIDQSTDTCTNNFCTLNPLSANEMAFSNGNLDVAQASDDGGGSRTDDNARGTIGVKSGKWYWETKLTGATAPAVVGICFDELAQGNDLSGSTGVYAIQNASATYAYKRENGTTAETAGFPNPVATNIMSLAFDADNAKLYIGINGTYYNLAGATGDPAGGSNETFSSIDTSFFWLPWIESRGDNQQALMNFGSGTSYAISSGNADANGYGNFEYAVPSGYYALNTKNLAEYG